MKSARIAVIVEGGLIQEILTDDSRLIGTPVIVIDYDTDEDAEDSPSRVMNICDARGNLEPAWVTLRNMEKCEINLEGIHAWLGGRQ